MTISSVAAGAVPYTGSGGTTAAIATSLIAQANVAEKQQITTLFSTLGQNVNALA